MSEKPFLECKLCDVFMRGVYEYKRHINTAKHKKKIMAINDSRENKEELKCEKCDFKCSKKSLWLKHISTKKHKRKNEDILCTESQQYYYCDYCAKKYANYKSYWSHKTRCYKKLLNSPSIPEKKEEDPEESKTKDQNDYSAIINKLLIENHELKNFIVEQSKDTKNILDKVLELSKPQTINNTMNTTNRVNINVFLHEQCKNAVNLSEFIENIDVTHEDLENNAQLGFVNGISKIFLDNLKQLSIYERPIHCTDVKRETMYIRDEDTWTKDENDKKIKSAIQEVSRKSIKKLNNWKEINPDYQDVDSEFSNKCIVIHQGSNAGQNRDTYYPKVIKTIAREVNLKL